jgi:hypothetical protein
MLTLAEAAAELRKSRRWLQDWLRDHPVDASGIPFYAPLGRAKTFDDTDLARIRAATREEERCRLSSLTRGQAKRRTIQGAERTAESTLTALRALLTSGKRTTSSKDGASPSNVVSMKSSRQSQR